MSKYLLLLPLFLPGQDASSQQEIPQLIERLSSPDVSEREHSEKGLFLKGESALEALGTASKSDDAEVAARARRLIGEINAHLELVKRLKDGDPKERIVAVTKLRNIATKMSGGHPPKHKSDRPDLGSIFSIALSDSSPEVRLQAVCALAYMNHGAAFQPLVQASKHKDSKVRYYACMGLGWLGRSQTLREKAVKALTHVVESEEELDFSVKYHAAWSLIELGAPPNDAVFMEALKRGTGNAKVTARALQNLKRKDSIFLLIKNMSSATPDDAKVIGQTLERLTGQSLGADPVKWYKWLEKNKDKLPKQLE